MAPVLLVVDAMDALPSCHSCVLPSFIVVWLAGWFRCTKVKHVINKHYCPLEDVWHLVGQ